MKNYLVTTVRAEEGYTHNNMSNLYSKQDLQGTDYKRLPTRIGQTITYIDDVEGLNTVQKWVTTITRIY